MASEAYKTEKTPPKKIKNQATAAIWRKYGSLRVYAAVHNVPLGLLRDVLKGHNKAHKRWTKGYTLRKKLERQGLIAPLNTEMSA